MPATCKARWLSMSMWLRKNVVIVVSVLGWVIILGLDYWLLWPLVSGPSSKDTAAVVAAAITVNGALLSGAVAYAGLLFKRSSDRRAAEAAEQSNRTAELEQQRLHMEAAMKAVSLLTTDGKAAPDYQTSALLIVLAELGQLGLAVDLAAELWPADAITRTCGVELVDRCITSGDADLRTVGLRLLATNAKRLVFKRTVSRGDGVEAQVVQSWPRSMKVLEQGPLDAQANSLLMQARAAASDEAESLGRS